MAAGYRKSAESQIMHVPFEAQRMKRSEERHRQTRRESTGSIIRGHLIAITGELVGTFMFLWFAFAGTQAASVVSNGDFANPAGVTLVSLNFGMSLLVNVWVFYRISGGLFNPAVTLAMVLTGSLPAVRGVLLFPAQFAGAICAAALVKVMFPGPLVVVTTLGSGTSSVQGVFIEMVLTALLVFTILMLAAEKHSATSVAPVGIGLALFLAMMVGLIFTGASLNPARSLGPSVAALDFPSEHWIYYAGPFAGGLLAAAYYKFIKFCNYEEANPGQDAEDEKEKEKAAENSKEA